MASKGKVLIVDDDPDFTEVVRATLEAESFQVDCASDGAQGLVQMREDKPDLVLLDVIMAHPVEGVDVSEEMMEDPDLRNIPIVMVTSITDSQYIGYFPTDRYLHVNQFLTKPVPLAKLVEIANEYAG